MEPVADSFRTASELFQEWKARKALAEYNKVARQIEARKRGQVVP